MKNLLKILGVIPMFLLMVSPAFAAPNNAENNPNIVANYPTGDHGIPGEPATHNGSDVVMAAGKSGNFQQWFYGTTTEEGVVTEGDHSVWKLSKDGTCPDNTVQMTVNSGNFWGDYLVDGGTYCIRTNDFHVTK